MRTDRRGQTAAEALLMLSTAVASAVVVFTVNPQYAIAAAVAATLAMTVLVLRLAFDFERTAIAHRACKYRPIARCVLLRHEKKVIAVRMRLRDPDGRRHGTRNASNT